MARVRVRFAENFYRNLEVIRLFLAEQDASAVADDVFDAVLERLVPALEAHPRMGRDWLMRTPHSPKGKALRERIVTKLAGTRELREFILDDYMVLYALDEATAVLLAIRHHRQRACDVGAGPRLKP